ncbi:hypothetical protein FACS1894202_13880 [Clostridia bacterium]|nr:hypothetical protein FACS1894202_13880 [Clostridia bacterium]
MQAAENIAVSDAAVAALARCLYPTMRDYFESEKGKREFAEWQSRTGTAREDPIEKDFLKAD